MSKKMICLVSLVLVLSLMVGDVQAVNVTWTDAGLDHLWSTPGNWDTGTLPTSADWAIIRTLPGATIANEGALTDRVYLGFGGQPGVLTVDGVTLTSSWIQFAVSENQEGTLNMISGTITVGNVLQVGGRGSATLNMTGGTITVAYEMKIASRATATGHVNLDGGIITTNNFVMREEIGAVGTMNITAGTLIINGDQLSLVQGYIDDPNGWITAYDGNGTLQMDYDVTNKGKTTLTAIHVLNPNPADGALVSPGEVELSWTFPDTSVPGQPVLVDVYFTDDLEALQMFTDPAAIQVVSKQNVTSVVVQTQPKTQYYWSVDTYIGDPNDPVFGPIFIFVADNTPPEVDAGTDIVTLLVDGVRTGNLDGTVTDDGAIQPYTVQWTVVSEPNDPNSPDAVITDPSAEDTGITLSAVGEYVLQLEAFDGEYTGSDTVTINVYNDSCEAAWSLPDYEPLVGDLNWDCKVDEADLALLEENWLQDNSLTDDWFNVD
ncbi:hypothetical protein ES705_15675 [subsurface metagenome]